MFRTRLISGIVLMAVTTALMVYGSYPLFWVITGVSLIGLFELYRTVGMEKTPPAAIGYLSSIVVDILILDNGYESFDVADCHVNGYDGMLCHRFSKI